MSTLAFIAVVYILLVMLFNKHKLEKIIDKPTCDSCSRDSRTNVILPAIDANFDQRTLSKVYADNPLRTAIGANPMNWDIWHPTTLIEHSEPVKQAHGHWQHENGRHAVARSHADQLVWNRLATMDGTGGYHSHAALWHEAKKIQGELEREGYRGVITAHDLFVHNPGPIAERTRLIHAGVMRDYAGVVLSVPTYVEGLHA